MGTDLHHVLRSLCFNTEWNYAIFWRLKHRDPMVLTWEDAYYDNCEQHDSSGNWCSIKTQGSHYSHDPLELAMAQMSYHVYTLGEGVVGQVAITGKHQWIFTDNIVKNNFSPSEFSDVWQNHFSAGIRTIVVVAVVPRGVVQLGSRNKITENVRLVSHIKDVFMAQDSPVGHVQSSIDSALCEVIPQKRLASGTFPDCVPDLDRAINRGKSEVWSSIFPYSGKDSDSSYIFSLTANLKKAVEVVNKHGELESSNLEGDDGPRLHQSKSGILSLENSKLVVAELLDSRMSIGESSGSKDVGMSSRNNTNLVSHASVKENECAILSSKFVNSAVNDSVDLCHNEMFFASEPTDVKFQSNPENLVFQTEPSHVDTSSTSLMFPAGCELHEALGPAYMNKSNLFEWESKKVGDRITAEMPEAEGMNSKQLTSDSCPEHLLEAVVANVCHSDSHAKGEKSFCKSMQSLVTSEKCPEPSGHTTHTIDSENYSIDQPSMREEEAQQCLSSSGVYGVISPKWFSSPCPSACSEEQERSSGPAKNKKKRARPGETSKPRPRDRQLIQDRIKELRELTPNGSKCSIDSLLERTIKHMLFLQSITKHADKLNKCADAKLCPKETSMLGSSNYERGSSWAVEVGGNLKVCSIVVENLNKNGQMVVEMMCEESSHFLEITEAIRSLGLTILKGVTEARGDKTWICFIVEGQNNRNIHRMDILWSLVQILQPKNPIQCDSPLGFHSGGLL